MPPFIDETNFIQSARNLLVRGSYAPDSWQPFDPGVSSGFWTTLPSGVASLLGGGLFAVRATSFAFSLSLLTVAAHLLLGLAGRAQSLPWIQRLSISLCAAASVLWIVPYNEGAFSTLGEFPSVAYLGIGIALLGHKRFSWGAFFLGVSVFGGKWVNLAFALPVLGMSLLTQRASLKSKAGWFLAFCAPEFLNFAVILLTQGPGFLWDWFARVGSMFVNFGRLASGAAQSKSEAPRWYHRLGDPRLEWVNYSRDRKSRILITLFLPAWVWAAAFLGAKQKRLLTFKNSTILALFAGQAVFAIWYFFLHPFMWVRHVQPALIVGAGLTLAFFLKEVPDLLDHLRNLRIAHRYVKRKN